MINVIKKKIQVIRNTPRHKRKIAMSPKSHPLPIPTALWAHPPLCRGSTWLKLATWRSPPFLHKRKPREHQRGGTGVAGYFHFMKALQRSQVPPLTQRPFKTGLLATASEMTGCWPHRFGINMQIRIHKSPTSCFWIILNIQPLTMTNDIQRRKKKWNDLPLVSPTDLLVLEPRHFSDQRERWLGSTRNQGLQRPKTCSLLFSNKTFELDK